MIGLIMAAYNVADYQVTGYPAWVVQKEFDIAAKVAPEDRPIGVDAKEQLAARLRDLLTERCGLVVSHSTRTMTTYALIQDRKGSKLTAAPEPLSESVYGPGWIRAKTMSMAQLSGILSMFLQGPVVDQTGLAGTYKFDLKWSLSVGGTSASPSQSQLDIPELPGALQDHLGLKLVPARVDVDMVAVERISLPSAN